MQSGKLDRKITIANKTWKKDKAGFNTPIFTEFSKPWAEITNSRENEEINEGEKTVMVDRATFKIYYRAGITRALVVIFNNTVYQITGIYNPGYRNEYLYLYGETERARGNSNG